MLVALLASAAQFSLPEVVGLTIPDVRAVFSPDDMPAYVQLEGVTRFVFTRTTVSPSGKVQDCAAERSGGDAKLDAWTCAIILRRAKFQPATWIDGSPAFGVLRVPVTWAIGSPPSQSETAKAYPPDIDMTVNQLPKGAKPPVSVALMIAVDESGKVVSCRERLPTWKAAHAKSYPALVSIACEQMVSHFTAAPAKDTAGKSVRSVQSATVSFTTSKAAP